METRQVILDQLMNKFDLVMEQFIKEIGIVENFFIVSVYFNIGLD